MRILKTVLFSFCFFLHCQMITAQDENGLASVKDLDPTENLPRPYKGTLEIHKASVLLGDVNGDQQKDTAFISYKRVLSPDNTYEKECGQNVCYVRIKFSSDIPEMIMEAYRLSVEPTLDVNGDGRAEILIFRELEQYNWSSMRLYSFYQNKWHLLSDVPVFLNDDEAYEKRIIKSGAKYYIVSDVWNKDYSLISRKKILIKQHKTQRTKASK